MAKTIIAEGRTSTEAIEKGLNELGVSKDRVDIKVLENDDKRSFFSILAPRVVKVEMTLKEGVEPRNQGSSKIEGHKSGNYNHTGYNKRNDKYENREHEEYKPHVERPRVYLKPEEVEIAKKNLVTFLDEFVAKEGSMQYSIHNDEEYIYVEMNGENSGTFIGYRGETLNAMQTLLTSIANKHLDTKAHIILNIAGYREKRQKALEELAGKLSKSVIRTGKQVTLEPMSAYERKVIHNYLQSSDEVRTYSVGEEPYRKVVISRK